MNTSNQVNSGSGSGSGSATVMLPRAWTDTHTAFVKDLAEKGEVAGCILILFEAEFAEMVGVTEDVVRWVVVGM